MSPRFWMVTNRRRDAENLNSERGPVTYCMADGCDPTMLATWTKLGATAFKRSWPKRLTSWEGRSSRTSKKDSPTSKLS